MEARIFNMVCLGIKTSELLRRGEYDYSGVPINDDLFPIEEHAPFSRIIEFVEFDHDPNSKEVLAEFAHRKLVRPTYEDALTFGAEYPDEQLRLRLPFLHEPVQVDDEDLVLVLYGGIHHPRRIISLGHARGLWGKDSAFAGIRE